MLLALRVVLTKGISCRQLGQNQHSCLWRRWRSKRVSHRPQREAVMHSPVRCLEVFIWVLASKLRSARNVFVTAISIRSFKIAVNTGQFVSGNYGYKERWLPYYAQARSKVVFSQANRCERSFRLHSNRLNTVALFSFYQHPFPKRFDL